MKRKQVIRRYRGRERPYFERLSRQLLQHQNWSDASVTKFDVDQIVDAARVSSRPLLEKANCWLIYRAWSDGRSLVDAAKEMIDQRRSADGSGLIGPNDAQQVILDHYTTDLVAQLCRDRRGHIVYAGIDQFITMSGGLPRNLLVILKNIFRWALFNGEAPFEKKKISLDAQRTGVRDATDWFFADAKPLGEEGEQIQKSINRLGDMLRRFRFSDKPVESSLTTFSVDLSSCSSSTREFIDLAEKWALLIRTDTGQKHRNTGLSEDKFQLHPLLAPKWDLPTARRGAIALRVDEVEAIFDPDHDDQFRPILRERLARMNVPFYADRGRNALQTKLDLGN